MPLIGSQVSLPDLWTRLVESGVGRARGRDGPRYTGWRPRTVSRGERGTSSVVTTRPPTVDWAGPSGRETPHFNTSLVTSSDTSATGQSRRGVDSGVGPSTDMGCRTTTGSWKVEGPKGHGGSFRRENDSIDF